MISARKRIKQPRAFKLQTHGGESPAGAVWCSSLAPVKRNCTCARTSAVKGRAHAVRLPRGSPGHLPVHRRKESPAASDFLPYMQNQPILDKMSVIYQQAGRNTDNTLNYQGQDLHTI